VTLTVKDAAGNTATDSVTVTARARPTGFPLWAVGAVAAIIVAIAVSIVFLRKRS
jgi:3-oxoacyl-(acyl-carrier-protein) synthase